MCNQRDNSRGRIALGRSRTLPPSSLPPEHGLGSDAGSEAMSARFDTELAFFLWLKLMVDCISW
jgi:hypothetical protein